MLGSIRSGSPQYLSTMKQEQKSKNLEGLRDTLCFWGWGFRVVEQPLLFFLFPFSLMPGFSGVTRFKGGF